MVQLRLGHYVRRSHNDKSVAEIKIQLRAYLRTVCAHEQITWSAIVVHLSVLSRDFTNAIFIEDIPQTPVRCLRLEDDAFAPGDEVEE